MTNTLLRFLIKVFQLDHLTECGPSGIGGILDPFLSLIECGSSFSLFFQIVFSRSHVAIMPMIIPSELNVMSQPSLIHPPPTTSTRSDPVSPTTPSPGPKNSAPSPCPR